MLIGHANGYDVAVGDIVNAYLNARTKEMIWTTADLSFVKSGYARKVGSIA